MKEMVKIGQLCLNLGEYHGMRIVSSEWIEQMLMVHALPGQKYHNMKYGYFWWIINEDEKIYSAIGDSGNVIYVFILLLIHKGGISFDTFSR